MESRCFRLQSLLRAFLLDKDRMEGRTISEIQTNYLHVVFAFFFPVSFRFRGGRNETPRATDGDFSQLF